MRIGRAPLRTGRICPAFRPAAQAPVIPIRLAQGPVTVTCAHPVAWLPTMAVAVIRVGPAGLGTVTLKPPSAPATVVSTLIESAGEPGCPAPTTTVAPGAVLPLTTVRVLAARVPGAGVIIVSGSTDGAPPDLR